MKQTTYSYNLDQLIASLIDDIHDIDDGYYRLSFLMETVPAVIDRLHPSQREGFFPGIISRIMGVELIQVEGPGPLTVQVLYGRLVVATEEINGFDPNNSGFIESSESFGEDSGRIGESDSSRGDNGSPSGAPPKRPSIIRSITGRGR